MSQKFSFKAGSETSDSQSPIAAKMGLEGSTTSPVPRMQQTLKKVFMTGQELFAARKSVGLTQSDMAKRLGLTIRGYQKLESGETPIKNLYAKIMETIVRRGGNTFVPRSGPDGYALAGFMIARASYYALLDAKLITGEQAVQSLETFIDDLPTEDVGVQARGLMQAVINSIAKQYGAL